MEQMIANLLPWFLVGVLVGGAYMFGSTRQELHQEKIIKAVMDDHRDDLERAHVEGVQKGIDDLRSQLEDELKKARQEGWDAGYDAGYEEAMEDA